MVAAVYFEYLTTTFNSMTPSKGFDYRELFSESDIKRAVVDSSYHRNTLLNHV
jgi:hypothetical protein